MEYFKSGIKTVLGTPDPSVQPSGYDTVVRLVERVINSTLLEDRRDACRALKAMSKKHRVHVGALGMEALKQVLELDRADAESVTYALDCLVNITSPIAFDEEEMESHLSQTPSTNLGEQFTEIYVKDPQNIQLILDLLDEYDFRVRLSSVRLLTTLLTNRPKDIQDVILVKPMGVSKLMDLLSDAREVIRNDTLLLLIKLTKGNANIQKIVAFENAFDKLFEIISAEGFSEGGIVVEDCLLLMLNLLKNNSSNINFFREGSYIQRMLPMFKIAEDDIWTPQKSSNLHCMLQLVRTLVSPSNSVQIVTTCQKIMYNCGLLDALCGIIMASGIPADILTETINTIGEVVRGDLVNQEYLGNLMAPCNPPRPAIVVLLMNMVNEKQPFLLRCAVLYCFQCYLYRNEMGQSQLVQTLLPSTAEVSTMTTGHLLCGGLLTSDSLSNWLSAVALMHGIIENPAEKEQLLRVLLASTSGTGTVSLIHQCTLILMHTAKVQTKVAILMLLSMWLSHCPKSVSAFLNLNGSVAYLVSQITSNENDENEYLIQGICAFLLAICIHFNDDSVVGYTSDDLKQLLIKRIGMEIFSAKLSEVPKNECYNKASKHPQLRAQHSVDVLVDYEFCKLFKVLESVLVQGILKCIQENGDCGENDKDTTKQEDSEMIEKYKLLIRQQDSKLQELIAQMEVMHQHNSQLQIALNDSLSSNSHLKDENTLLKAQMSAMGLENTTPLQDTQQLDHLNRTVEELQGRIGPYENSIKSMSVTISELTSKLQSSESEKQKLNDEFEKFKRDQEDLLDLLAEQEKKLVEYRLRLLSLNQVVDDELAQPSTTTTS